MEQPYSLSKVGKGVEGTLEPEHREISSGCATAILLQPAALVICTRLEHGRTYQYFTMDGGGAMTYT